MGRARRRQSVAAFRRAMWPLDEHRRTLGGSRRMEEDDVDDFVAPTDPVPAVDVPRRSLAPTMNE